MKTTKMSLANLQGKMSRAEMKRIMAGSGDDGGRCGDCTGQACTLSDNTAGKCERSATTGVCHCLGIS